MPPPSIAESAHRPPLLGQRYVVRKRIGRGGTSSVFLVFDLRLRAWRAAKVMHPDSASDLELRERFVREAAAMANLEHPHVARVSDVGSDGPIPFLVMEWLEGGSAAAWVMRHGPMPLELALDVVMQACEALAFVHGHGVIHRDVNPRNLLFDRSGTCKLTDFGIARVRQELIPEDLDQHATMIGTVMGTEAYMAPEKKRDSSDVDERADIYGVGATLYSLLTGRLPPDHPVAGRNDPRLRKVPPPLAPVLARACANLASDRFSSARELHETLGRLRPRSAVAPRTLVAVDGEPLSAIAPRALTAEEHESLAELLASGACAGHYEPLSAPPPADSAPAQAPEASRGAGPGLIALGLSVVAMGLSIGMGAASVLALVGARTTSEARIAVLRSEVRYERAALRHREKVLAELAAAQLDPAVAEAYQRLLSPPDEGLGQRAEAVLDSLSLATRQLDPLPPGTRLALDELTQAQSTYRGALLAFEQASSSLSGRIAASAGLVPKR